MTFDRLAFLSLAASLAAFSTTGCSSNGSDEDADQGALETGGGQCVEARSVDGVYPVMEGCFIGGLEGGPLSQCLAWSNHFEAGVAHAALANLEGKTDWGAVYDAGRKALQSTCARSDAEEAQLKRFCESVNGDRNDCLTYARGIRAESRTLLKKCVNETHLPLYSCVEGLGWDDAPQKCVSPDEVGGGSGFSCDDLPAGKATCHRVTASLRAHIGQETIGCMIQAVGYGQSAVSEQEADGIGTSCGLTMVTRTCLDLTTAQAPCEALVGELKTIDPELGVKDHLNAGGRFTKQCRSIFSGLNEKGRASVAACIQTQARAAGSPAKIREQVSISKCLNQ